MNRFAQLYLPRQLLALTDFTQHVCEASIAQCLCALTLSRVADYCSTQSRWDTTQERNVNSFGRQALPMLWDFAELVPFRHGVGAWDSMMGGILKVIERTSRLENIASVQNADATEHPLPNESTSVWFTDPPYYDSVPYADLSDFFYVWLRRSLPNDRLLRNLFESHNPLTPKVRECVWNRAYKIDGKEKDPQFFERTVAAAFSESRRLIQDAGIGSVVFAHKTTEGWEALLSGLSRAGWVVTASWPIATEQKQRLVARDSAALATSVHLVCRPRPENAPVGDWADVLRELPGRVGGWMERLQEEGIRGADLVFACIGPALEIFSRYSKVVDPEEREIPLGGDPQAKEPHKRGFLAYVWEVVGRTALKQVLKTEDLGDYDEDARLTALFLWTLRSNGNGGTKDGQSNGGKGETGPANSDSKQQAGKGRYTLPYDIVRRFSQPLGIRLEQWEGRLIEINKGVVRLLPVTERAAQLVEPGVAHDFTLADLSNRMRPKQLDLFEERQKARDDEQAGAARRRLEKETWSHLHLNTITTLDHVHKAMLFQKQGQSSALRELLFYEQHYRPNFLRLANALSALYPKGSEEKRLVDAMLLAVPR